MNATTIGQRALATALFLSLIACGNDRLAAPAQPYNELTTDIDSDGRILAPNRGGGNFPVPPAPSSDLSGASLGTIMVGGPGDVENVFPFGGPSTGFFGTRYQQAYSSSQFAPLGPVLITAVSFVNGDGRFRGDSHILHLSTISTSIDGLSISDFDGNRGSNNAAFSSVFLSGAVPSTLTINADVPFFFDPAQGNLLLDIVTLPGPGPMPFPRASFASRSGGAAGIFSRYHNFGTGNFGWGLVTRFEYALPSLENLSAAVANAATNGTLVGTGPSNSTKGRLNAWRHMLDEALASHEAGNDKHACNSLKVLFSRVDGEFPPPDFVAGPSAAGMAAMIQAILDELGCA